MRKIILGSLLAGYVGAAAAGGVDAAGDRDLGPDFSARAYYRLDFGGSAAHRQSVGLRFDNAFTERRDTPALFQASIDGSGVSRLTLRGLELHGSAVAADADGAPGKKGFWWQLSTGQWIAVGFTAVVFIAAAGNATGGGGGDVTGSGGG